MRIAVDPERNFGSAFDGTAKGRDGAAAGGRADEHAGGQALVQRRFLAQSVSFT